MIDYNDDLPPSLEDAVRQMRDDVSAPTDLWRRRVLNAVAALPGPHGDRPSRWSMRPIVAVAAGIACMLVGGATVAVLMRALAHPSTSATASTPVVSTVRFA